ncbi:hypothetical protein [uncultured Massilia sp.]|uniref:hypothetical protein n=1 Tax=uncultured Massilia sp. TaxID=169973 RepID=UPI002601353F|nr:hypothetical protein [uncultured Massilia sp.]
MSDDDDKRPHTGAGDANARIVDYWNRRAALGRAEWVDFYHCVVRLLMRTSLPEEYNGQEERRDLVNRFFQDKILLNAETSKAGPLQNAYALHGYLKNYAKDVWRASRKHVAGSLDDMAEKDGVEVADDVDLADDAAAMGSADPHIDLLGEAGIDVQAVLHSADGFIETLAIGERAYLRHHSCADGKPEPVSRIAQRLNLGTMFHIRAQKLGITRSKGETFRGYEKTKIGAWLRSTGAQLDPEWRQELAALLILLCQQVRLRLKEVA